jgi:hypothetical protein
MAFGSPIWRRRRRGGEFNPASVGNLQQFLFGKTALSGGSVIPDESSNKGTARPIQLGRQCDFDGVNDEIRYTGAGLNIDISLGFSCSFWCNPDTLAAGDRVMFRLDNSSGTEQLLIYSVNLTGQLGVFGTNFRGGVPVITTTTGAFQVGVLKHYFVTFNNSTGVLNVYVNGALFFTISGITTTLTAQTNNQITIGSRKATQNFDGKMFDFRFWNSDQSANLATVYAGGEVAGAKFRYNMDEQAGFTVFDSAGQGINAVATNITTSTFHSTQNTISFQNNNGYCNYMDFDGVNDRVTLPITVAGITNATFRCKVSTVDIAGCLISDGTRWLMLWQEGNAGSINNAVGSPTMTINGVPFSGTRGDLYTALRNGGTKEIVVTGLDISAYTSVNLMWFGDGSGFTTAGTMWDVSFDLTSNGSIDHSYLGYGNTNANWLDQVGSANGTVVGSPSLLYVPRNEAIPTQNVLGNTLQFSGRVPYNALLKQSNCLDFDGVNDEIICGNVGTVTTFKGWVKLDAINQNIWSLTNNTNTRIHVTGATLTAGASLTLSAISTNGTVTTAAAAGALLNTLAWTYLEVTFTSTSATDLRFGASGAGNFGNIQAAGWQFLNGTTVVADYEMAEGAGLIVYDSAIGAKHGTLINGVAWAKQDFYHANITLGYSRYDHASSADILVPYSLAGVPLVITPPAGYTKISDNPAGKFHNGCETLIDFTGGVASPQAVINSWETAWAFNTARVNPEFDRTRTSGVTEVAMDRALAYSTALSGNDLTKVQNFTATRAL